MKVPITGTVFRTKIIITVTKPKPTISRSRPNQSIRNISLAGVISSKDGLRDGKEEKKSDGKFQTSLATIISKILTRKNRPRKPSVMPIVDLRTIPH